MSGSWGARIADAEDLGGSLMVKSSGFSLCSVLPEVDAALSMCLEERGVCSRGR